MIRKIRYTVDKELVRCSPEGAVNADSIADFVNDVCRDKEIGNEVIKVLFDTRRATFAGKPDDLKSVMKKFWEHYRKFEYIKVAVILQNPYETAISIILKEKLKQMNNLTFGLFSTEAAAVKWLN